MNVAGSYGHLTAVLVALVLEKVASIVHTSAADTVTAHGADIVIAIDVARGCGSTHTISASTDVTRALQSCIHSQECLPLTLTVDADFCPKAMTSHACSDWASKALLLSDGRIALPVPTLPELCRVAVTVKSVCFSQ